MLEMRIRGEFLKVAQLAPIASAMSGQLTPSQLTVLRRSNPKAGAGKRDELLDSQILDCWEEQLENQFVS